jgi:pimeloyl-ACP methyl ester carboxylesterase
MPTEFFQHADGTLAYDDSGGDGEPVIMLPGMGALRSEYRFLAPELAGAGYRAISVDLRGHGESSSDWPDYSIPAVGDDILALIDHVDAGPAHVIGTSYAPGAAVWAAAERPQAILSLVLIGAFVREPQTSAFQKIVLPVMMNGPWKVRAWAMFYKTLYPTQQPDDFEQYLDNLRTNLSQPGRFAAFKAMAGAPKAPATDRLSRVDKPTLVVMGSKDPDFPSPEEEARYIADSLTGQVLMVEGAGHYPQTEMPEKVTPGILEFLAVHSSNDAS